MVLQEERGLRGLKEAMIDNCLMKQREARACWYLSSLCAYLLAKPTFLSAFLCFTVAFTHEPMKLIYLNLLKIRPYILHPHKKNQLFLVRSRSSSTTYPPSPQEESSISITEKILWQPGRSPDSHTKKDNLPINWL